VVYGTVKAIITVRPVLFQDFLTFPMQAAKEELGGVDSSQ
jgi:hypothetical protein